MLGTPDAVLLDRDGTINVKAPEGSYITAPEQLELLPGAADAIRALNEAGVPVVVVTNQRGIALGHMTEDDLAGVHARLGCLLHQSRARVDGIFYCPHDKGLCQCRKPGTLLLRQAQGQLALDTLANSVMIGDSPSDVEAGRRLGARTILLSPGSAAAGTGAEVAISLLDAVSRLLTNAP